MNNLLNKFLGMNTETRERTIAAIIMYILNFLVVFNIINVSDAQVDAIIKLGTVIVVGITWLISHYKNNDYTEEAVIGTGITRQLKLEKEDNYIGDFFFTEDYYDDAVEEEDYEQDDIQTV